MSLYPRPHYAPYQIVDTEERSPGDRYIPLMFADGIPRGTVAVFTYDEIGVRQQLHAAGYTTGPAMRFQPRN